MTVLPQARHIFLVGFMGAGKSTVAALLADEFSEAFVDLDERIVEAVGMPVSEIFAQRGEEAFREAESAALRAVAAEPASVVACGGGIVLRPENRALLKEAGLVVYLEVTAGEALARIGDVDTRPLLAGSSGTLAATSLLSAREALYRSVADLTIDTVGRTPEQITAQIRDYVERPTR
jgi:shikimate kinase